MSTHTLSRTRRWLRATAHVTGLWALVIAAPLLDALARSPEFFTAHRADGSDLVLVALGLTCAGLVAGGALLALATGFGPRATDLAAAGLVGLLGAAYGAQIAYRLGVVSWWSALAVVAVLGPASALAWWRARAVRFALTVLSLGSLVAVPALFLSRPPIRELTRVAGVPIPTRHASQLPPVVLIVFDELPLVGLLDAHARIDADRFPHLAALASDGVWFRNATSVSDFTSWAVPAILTGYYPRPRSLPNDVDHPDNIFMRLAATHRMQVVEPWTAICPSALCKASTASRPERLWSIGSDLAVVLAHALLPKDLRSGLPDPTVGFANFGNWAARGRVRAAVPAPWMRATSFVDGIDAHDQPAFFFLHSMLSHHPPTLLPSGQGYADLVPFSGLQIPRLDWSKDEWEVTMFRQAALVQAGAVDTIVGRLVARLRATGLYERSAIVITADHGMAFVPGQSARGASGRGAAGVVPVPFIVKLPASRPLRAPGTIDDGNVETVDVVPTIADAIGLDLSPPVEGRSAFSPAGTRTTKRFFVDRAERVTRFDPSDIAAARDAEAIRQAEMFGVDWWPSPAPEGLRKLLGRRLSTLAIVPGRSVAISVDRPSALAAVRLDAPMLPAQVTGRVHLESGDPLPVLALVLNGEVVAVTRPFTADGRWAALVSPTALRSGANDLRVFIVDPARPGTLVRTSPPIVPKQ